MNIISLFAPIRSFLALGGPVVAILAIISVISLALILLKLTGFGHARIGQTSRARHAIALYRQGKAAEAEAYAAKGRSGAAQAVALALAMQRDTRFSKTQIEEEIARFATEHLHKHQSGFRFLDAVVQIAPLLGLFGTVLGMIEAFQKLQQAGNSVDPSILAGGIWVALLTTAAGLAVAMPVSVILTFLEQRLENDRVAIETLATEVLAPQLPSISGANSNADGSARLSGQAAHAY
ncbi:MotA/TolQ/ExbB proton channel family protein [Notoacmeibacter ruber]|uniref:MotA/TolQ/ExbB proton channel family protein n=1 Tax=Notoacmeibacter ruber TaxID=2670375 RepID=A0A3L7JIE1_9HYPH|nr:MotA/TolQ/ExbB proton channel family protein [Notoacmeibacter ruber]RLQ88252.1 MotA/TolQ/ExbB proton channel family protein [Notoacmeibacter ruber]